MNEILILSLFGVVITFRYLFCYGLSDHGNMKFIRINLQIGENDE